MAIDNATTLLLQSDVDSIVNWLVTNFAPIVVAAVGVFVSFVIYRFERKKFDLTREAEDKRFRLTALTEAFRLLNDVKHREARKVVYGNANMSSFDIFGLVRPTRAEDENYDELTSVCKDILRSDFNQIGTLIHHNLLDEKIFIEKYYWIILKIWSLLRDDIERRRKGDGPPNYMQHLKDLNGQAEKYAKQHDIEAYKRFHSTTATTPRNILNQEP